MLTLVLSCGGEEKAAVWRKSQASEEGREGLVGVKARVLSGMSYGRRMRLRGRFHRHNGRQRHRRCRGWRAPCRRKGRPPAMTDHAWWVHGQCDGCGRSWRRWHWRADCLFRCQVRAETRIRGRRTAGRYAARGKVRLVMAGNLRGLIVMFIA